MPSMKGDLRPTNEFNNYTLLSQTRRNRRLEVTEGLELSPCVKLVNASAGPKLAYESWQTRKLTRLYFI